MQAVDYEQIQQVLTQAHSLTDAAEAHGTLAGCLCSTAAYRWAPTLLGASISPSPIEGPRASWQLAGF